MLVGARAVLIRGPAGAGKSRLALALLEAADTGLLPFARLVGDDRVHLEACHGRLLVRPAAALAGLIEVRGLRHPAACLSSRSRWSVSWSISPPTTPSDCPPPRSRETVIAGISLPRLAVASGIDPLPAVLALLGTAGTA